MGPLSFALFLDTPPVMSEGNWRVGVYLDDAASDDLQRKLVMLELPGCDGVVDQQHRGGSVRRLPASCAPERGL
jgi:hypothetical protein